MVENWTKKGIVVVESSVRQLCLLAFHLLTNMHEERAVVTGIPSGTVDST